MELREWQVLRGQLHWRHYRSLRSVGASSTAIDAIESSKAVILPRSDLALGTPAGPGSPKGSIVSGILDKTRCDSLCVTEGSAVP